MNISYSYNIGSVVQMPTILITCQSQCFGQKSMLKNAGSFFTWHVYEKNKLLKMKI